MMRLFSMIMAGLIAGLSAGTARAHELWFQPAEKDAAVVRLTFGDSPAPGEAERVAEIAHAKVWGDGLLLEVGRLPDGLKARLLAPRPDLLSAHADRGIVDFMGDSFVITLAAYSQPRPIERDAPLKLGLADDQLRLLLVAGESGSPVVRATWKNEPVPDLTVQVFRNAGETPTVVELNGRGEMPCPNLSKGPVSLLAVVMDRTPGTRDGRKYSHIRYKATLTIEVDVARGPEASISAEALTRVREIHGAAGPWAVAGYRIGERALKELGLPRHSFSLLVVHRCPAQVQYSCVADGLQAATGASPGKLNLKVEEAAKAKLSTTVHDRKSGRTLLFTLNPEFARSISDLPFEQLQAEGERVASLPDQAIFHVTELAREPKK